MEEGEGGRAVQGHGGRGGGGLQVLGGEDIVTGIAQSTNKTIVSR